MLTENKMFRTAEIGTKLFQDGVPQTRIIQGKVLAAGIITKQESTVANRVVLIDTGNEFAVWDQYFPNYELDNPDVSKTHVLNGSYYGPQELHLAFKRFGERCVDSSKSVESIYRD